MITEERFIEVFATDTINTILDKLEVYNDKHRENNIPADALSTNDAQWIVVIGESMCQSAVIDVARLGVIKPEDRDKTLREALGEWLQRTDVVSKMVLENDDAAEIARRRSPSRKLIVQQTVTLIIEDLLPEDCQSKCPVCGKWSPQTEEGKKIWCLKKHCGAWFSAHCNDTGTSLS